MSSSGARRRLATVFCAGALTLLGCNPAPGVAVLAETPSHHALHWAVREIVLTPAPETPGAEIPPMLDRALQAAAGRWNRALRGCGAPRLLANERRLDAAVIRDDLVNAVVLHEKRWCPPGSAQLDECYPGQLLGRTHLYPRLALKGTADGELAGADVEVNGVGKPWVGQSSDEAQLALQAILLHELGHVLGLDHPCGPNGEYARPDKPILACDAARFESQVMRPDWPATPHGSEMEPSRAEVATLCRAYERRQ